ncbi:restriction endonuclease [Cellulomonas fimi]|uniref:Restriction endonuclease n=1 Tax=Cellulomonas fimi TaxID=1708 RepID=A0A7Y0LWX0_CELFI|nr:restriction endonuclease [Cellulomonas fimi]NMR19737.1 restriction endonuclease [Cellulomonas fimi]
MTVPTYEEFMLPTLRVLADDQPRSTRATVDAAADLLGLDGSTREETIPSGLLTYLSRGQWAQTYLVQAGLIARPKRGTVTITDVGRALLAENPDRVDSALLRRYPAFTEFVSRKQTSSGGSRPPHADAGPAPASSAPDLAPDELVANAEQANRAEVESDVLTRVRALDPAAFERLVIELLVAMGYGTAETTTHTGRSGDEGIDGIIHRDALGLDRVYLQAKRYTDNPVGPEAINAFYGALQRKRADRGVFLTSSTFTAGARAAEHDFRTIVLIDGAMLARLMVDHGVGVQIASTHVLKRLDQDYFDEL